MRSQPIDRAALTRQFLAAAVDRAVDNVLPGVTPCTAALPQHANVKNEPNASEAARRSPYETAKKVAPGTAIVCTTVLPRVTRRDAVLPNSATCKTNPNPPAVAHVTLTPQQLAAARLIACGHPPVVVAHALGIHRQTLWRWRGLASFRAEVFRLHECLTWTAGATAARRG